MKFVVICKRVAAQKEYCWSRARRMCTRVLREESEPLRHEYNVGRKRAGVFEDAVGGKRADR